MHVLLEPLLIEGNSLYYACLNSVGFLLKINLQAKSSTFLVCLGGFQVISFITRRKEDIESPICFGNASRNRRRKAFIDCFLLTYFYIFLTKMSLASVDSVDTALTFKDFIDLPFFFSSFNQPSRHFLYSAF